MAKGFNEEIQGIYRLKVPFEKIYTSVFLVITDSKKIMVDCATTRDDVDRFIVPALSEQGFEMKDLDMLVLTHRHGDHAGGLERVLQLAPDIAVITDIRHLAKNVSTYALAGHTADSIGILDERTHTLISGDGILDERTHTLISGDGIQGAGVDKYRCGLKDSDAYLETLERIKNDNRIENILFSHAYEPWNTEHILGRKNVRDCTEKCKEYIKK